VGKIVLDRYFVDYYKEVLNIVSDGTTLIVDAEKDVLGVTHADQTLREAVEEELEGADSFLAALNS
jgi:hypothetical protein